MPINTIMKKSLLSISLLFSIYVNAQVGINTETPKATLDITANPDGTFSAPNGVLIPRVSKESAKNVTSDPSLTPVESTIVYINDTSSIGTQVGAAIDIDTKRILLL